MLDIIINFLHQWYIFIILCLFAGIIAGFLAGLLGIGGGIIIVPVIFHAFALTDNNITDIPVFKVAVSTSLAAILPTGISAAYAHYKRNNIDFSVFKKFFIPTIIGTMSGAWLFTILDNQTTRWIFSILTGVMALQLLLIPDKYIQKTDDEYRFFPFPFHDIWISFTAGISAIIGIGGASLNVPTMRFYGVPIQIAIGTASLIGVIISSFANISVLSLTIHENINLPFMIGYINVIALISLIMMSIIIAPFGAKIVSKIDKKYTKLIFTLFLLFASFKMAIG